MSVRSIECAQHERNIRLFRAVARCDTVLTRSLTRQRADFRVISVPRIHFRVSSESVPRIHFRVSSLSAQQRAELTAVGYNGSTRLHIVAAARRRLVRARDGGHGGTRQGGQPGRAGSQLAMDSGVKEVRVWVACATPHLHLRGCNRW